MGESSFWYRPTRVVPDQRPLNGRCCCCIYYDPRHPPCSTYMLDSPFRQPLSRSSLVFLLVLDPLLHTLCISSPSHHLIFATHAHTITACFVVVPVLCHLFLISLSAPCLEICLFTLMPHIHLTILISAQLKCHHVFLPYRPGLTSMQRTASHTTTVQHSSHNQ